MADVSAKQSTFSKTVQCNTITKKHNPAIPVMSMIIGEMTVLWPEMYCWRDLKGTSFIKQERCQNSSTNYRGRDGGETIESQKVSFL